MSNTDLKATDYSNTIITQNEDNASVVSIFPLVMEEVENNTVEATETTETNGVKTAPAVPQTVSGGGGGY